MKSKKLLSLFFVVLLLSMVFSNAVFAKNSHSLVALGDSISFGWNLSPTNDHPSDQAFPSLIANSGDEFRVSNLAVGGAASGDLLNLLKTESYRDALKHSKAITLEIGSNDFLEGASSIIQKLGIPGYTPSMADMQLIGMITRQYSTNMAAIISEIRSVTKAPIILYNIYNPFYGVDLQAGALLAAPNMLIQSYDSDPSIVVVDAFSAFAGKQNKLVRLSDVHPNIEGHKILANLGLNALESLEKEKEKDKEKEKVTH